MSDMVRNLNLEVPCKNMKIGCRKKAAATGGLDEDSIVVLYCIEEHEKECEHRPLFLQGEMKPFSDYLNMLKE